MTIELTTREELIKTLHLAAELEHNLMCQYLFAAYTMKRSTSEGLDEVQLEKTRGWGALMTLIARQEMEHMGLVLNLLSAIGGTPYFQRPNFPQRKERYGQLDIKSELTRFSKETIKRFQEFEAPHPAPGPDYCKTPGIASREDIRAQLLAPQIFTQSQTPAQGSAAAAETPALPSEIPFTSIQDLYLSLAAGLVTVAARIGEKNLFIGDVNAEIWGGPSTPYGAGSMDDLSQYGLDLIQVVDLNTAIEAIVEIVEQGEGILAPPDYIEHVHYCIFTSIYKEMGGFDAARPVVRNPLTRMHPDITAPDEVNIITRPETREIANLFNHTYELMLMMMLFLYGSSKKTQEQTVALMNAIFFPLMTMFIRPLSETLTQLPAFKDKKGNAGPGFELSKDLLMLPEPEDTWGEFQKYFDILTWQFDNLWIYQLRPADDEIVKRLRYMAENMRRLSEDWRTNWKNVGRS